MICEKNHNQKTRHLITETREVHLISIRVSLKKRIHSYLSQYLANNIEQIHTGEMSLQTTCLRHKNHLLQLSKKNLSTEAQFEETTSQFYENNYQCSIITETKFTKR